MSEPLLVIGNGMAAARFVEELSSRALGRYAVAVIGAEPRLAYNRVLLSSVLAGETTVAEIELEPTHWWRDRGVTVLCGKAAAAIDAAAHVVRLQDGTALPYAKLVLATGSSPVRLPIPGMDLAGVLTFRDLSDVASIEDRAGRGSRAVVIGGGLLGMEAAYGLAKRGASVTVLHLMDRLMERQLDARAAALLTEAVEAKGIAVRLGANAARLEGSGRVEAVTLADGECLPADLVVAAVGVRAETGLAKAARLAVNRGIMVDDRLTTSASDIFAIGDCAEHRGHCYGLVEPAYEQAGVLARHLVGEDATYEGSVLATNLKVSGVNVFSAGDFLGREGSEQIVLSDPGLDTYKKLVVAEDRLTGAVLYGDTTDGLWYLDLIRSGAPIAGMRSDLIFGRALAEREAA